MSAGEGISGNSSKQRGSEDRRVLRKIFDSVYSPECVEKKEQFHEVRGSKVDFEVALRGDRGGATRRVRHKLAPRWPHLWRGIVASGHRLLRSNFLGILGTPLGRVATDYGPSAVRPERGLAPKVASDPKAPKEEGPSVVPFTAAQIRL